MITVTCTETNVVSVPLSFFSGAGSTQLMYIMWDEGTAELAAGCI